MFLKFCFGRAFSAYRATALIGIVLVLLNLAFRESSAAKWLSAGFYDLAQNHLPASRSNLRDVPVIVDMHDLAQDRTDRGALSEEVRKLADAGAEAIAIDVDFSPADGVYLGESDPAFFSGMRDATVPIVLGVARSATAGKADWLGSITYADLAGAITMPLGRVDRVWAEVVGPEGRCPTLSSRLVQRAGRREAPFDPPWALAPLLEREREEEISGPFRGLGYAVDYSQLPQIERGVLGKGDLAHPALRKEVEGRLVLLGNFSQVDRQDSFAVPGSLSSHPGVAIQASSVYTLLRGAPYEPTLLGAIVLDVLFVLLGSGLTALLLAVGTCHKWRKEVEDLAKPSELGSVVPTWAVILAGAISFALCAVMVCAWRILWDDYVLLLGGFVLHALLHETAHKSIEQTKSFLERRKEKR